MLPWMSPRPQATRSSPLPLSWLQAFCSASQRGRLGRRPEDDGAVDDVVTGHLHDVGIGGRGEDLRTDAGVAGGELVVDGSVADGQIPGTDADRADLDRAGCVDPGAE